MGRAVGAVWGTQLLVSRVFARSFVYKVHFGVFSRAFSDDFHDENKLATSILAERGGGVQIPCFTLQINFASKWPASVAFGRLSPCVRGEKPKHLSAKNTHTKLLLAFRVSDMVRAAQASPDSVLVLVSLDVRSINTKLVTLMSH